MVPSEEQKTLRLVGPIEQLSKLLQTQQASKIS